jgi:electron transport complex protein RnfC
VDIGDHVLKGQMIARANGHVSVALHAPSSGHIIAIDDQAIPHPSGLNAPCITIETDGKDQWTPLKPIEDYKTLTAHELRQHIRYAGIVGLGGAGFPSFIKLNPATHHFVDTLIINGVECEPYISCDDMLMRERARGILDGIAIMRHAIKAKDCVIAIEDNKPEAIVAMQTAMAQHAEHHNTELVIVPTRYPAGSEKQLIQVITHQQVPNNKLPIDIGIVMHNVGTAYAIGRAINHGEPLISRIVTITGNNVKNAGNIEALLGSPIRDLLTFCETQWQKPSQLIMGGPMMGYQLSSSDLPITKTANCILAGVEEAALDTTPMPCIRCGDCATVCPVSLLPQQLYWYARAKDLEKTRDYNLFDCIECGCCNYVCPSEIPLVQYFRFAKTETMNQEQERQKSDAARIRHENRQARQLREKQEKELRQQQRKAALAASQAVKSADKETP